ncbi:hypothetical protein [Bifidobacterium subtile]|jgi:hypothetical protein|uniref:Uncharacterized protein n=1 Tax=Bifidobacterium subtile TaxID=77635 RepID=A0A087E5L3_9BIFI|nr:hypothetical protein [Bifidobacterium subtile]KFJ03064.1 hypothetical protein BISU_0993 [Bifidobacterium subtile]MCI1222449.1 hypothetical protein [Bifidobacterium subtile]MCI1240973.1 hypothetical protein [Bifidobacterium subtile]MCI1257931.1 hypothetical protein [Bifidobacterium subtile]
MNSVTHAVQGEDFGDSDGFGNSHDSEDARACASGAAEPAAAQGSTVETADDLLRRYPKLAELEGLEDEECIAAYSSVLVQLQRDLDSVRG